MFEIQFEFSNMLKTNKINLNLEKLLKYIGMLKFKYKVTMFESVKYKKISHKIIKFLF